MLGLTPLNLPTLLVFECVARHLSFTKAATELTLSTSSVSESIRLLEDQLGMRLFNRTTRSVALTEIGSRLIDSVAPALHTIRQSVSDLKDVSSRPSGRLRLNLSYVAFAILVKPALKGFYKRFPDIALDISLDNQMSDIIAGGFDAGIRLGHAVQQDMIAIPIGLPQKTVAVASPAYLRQHGTPKRPNDLLDHDCILQKRHAQSTFLEWSFREKETPLVLNVSGRLVVDEMRAALDAAREDCGIAYVYEQFAAQEIARSEIVPILSAFSPVAESFHLYYAHRVHMPGKLRAFIDYLQANAV
jgi:DNA-binding transcriptional LysR family regulator